MSESAENFKPKFKLLPSDHRMLKAPVERFNFLDPQTDPIALAYDLAEHLLYYGGVGLAANQIGLPYRALAIKASPMIVAFNPTIVDSSEELSEYEEGCLSFPGLLLKIKRPRFVRVRYTEPNGNTVTNRYADVTARVFQHEIDYLDGIVFTSRAHPLHLERARKKLKKMKRQMKK